MKIVLTGGGTLGHFYPLIAVSDKLKDISAEEKIVYSDTYYFGEKNMSSKMLADRSIKYRFIPSGKNRLYFSLQNFIDFFKLITGVIFAFFKLLIVYPDIVFSKGGYDSVPTCIAAYILRIPIMLHDSDAIPGRASLLISRLSSRVAVSYEECYQYFIKNITGVSGKIALTGQPIISKYLPQKNFKRELEANKKKNILIIGGSSGSVKINDAVLQILPELCANYNVIHQTGEANIGEVKTRASVILENYTKDGYSPYATLDLSKIYPQVDLIVSRAGSSMFEFSAWQIPSIIIPISSEVSRDQVANAEAMSKNALFKVLSEENLTPHLLLHNINKILSDEVTYLNTASTTSRVENKAAELIAREILNIVKSHY